MKRLIVIVFVVLFVSACSNIPTDAFRLSETALEIRNIQSRTYLATDKKLLLLSAAGVIQDMGYSIDESNSTLGVISASKNASAIAGGQVVASVAIALLTGTVTPIDKEQVIKLTLVVNEALNNKDNSLVRMTMQRVIWNTQGKVTRREQITDSEIYQQFFTKLSKSTFLEAHTL